MLIFEAYPVFSGAQRVTLNFCKVLKSNGFNITLLLADDRNGNHREKFSSVADEIILLNTSDKLTRYGNSDQWFKLSGLYTSLFKGLFPFYRQCFAIFKKHKFDYYYFCDPRGAVMMLFPSLFFKGKKICYLQSKNKLNQKLARLLYLTFTDHLLCPSTDVLESLLPSSKKQVLNYGIDFAQYSDLDPLPVKKELEALLPAGYEGRTKLLYGGLIRPHKGVHHLIYAIKYLKEKLTEREMPVVFLLGEPKGAAECTFQSTLLSYAKENNIDQYIYWLGWKDNVLEWMINCNYFIFPTIDKEKCDFEGFDAVIESSEGSPVVLIESSLCGLFTLASKVTGVNETITENQNGRMYDPNIPGALSEALLKIMYDKPAFVGFPHRERFSPETFANKILALFK